MKSVGSITVDLQKMIKTLESLSKSSGLQKIIDQMKALGIGVKGTKEASKEMLDLKNAKEAAQTLVSNVAELTNIQIALKKTLKLYQEYTNGIKTSGANELTHYKFVEKELKNVIDYNNKLIAQAQIKNQAEVQTGVMQASEAKGKADLAEIQRVFEKIAIYKEDARNYKLSIAEKTEATKKYIETLVGFFGSDARRSVFKGLNMDIEIQDAMARLQNRATSGQNKRSTLEQSARHNAKITSLDEKHQELLADQRIPKGIGLAKDALNKYTEAFEKAKTPVRQYILGLELLRNLHANAVPKSDEQNRYGEAIDTTRKRLNLYLGQMRAKSKLVQESIKLDLELVDVRKKAIDTGIKESEVALKIKGTATVEERRVFLDTLRTEIKYQEKINEFKIKSATIDDVQIAALQKKSDILRQRSTVGAKKDSKIGIDSNLQTGTQESINANVASVKLLNDQMQALIIRRDKYIKLGQEEKAQTLNKEIIAKNELLKKENLLIQSNFDILNEEYVLTAKFLALEEQLVKYNITDVNLKVKGKKNQEDEVVFGERRIDQAKKLDGLNREIDLLEGKKGSVDERETVTAISLATQKRNLLKEQQDIQAKIDNLQTQREPKTAKERNDIADINKITTELVEQKKLLNILQKKSKSELDKIHSAHKNIMSIMGQRLRFIATAGLAYKIQNGFVAMFKNSLEKVLELEKQIAEVGTLQTENMAEMNVLLGHFKSEILKLSEQYGEETSKLTKALYDIRSATISASESLGVLDVVTRAGKASLTDSATSTKAIIAILKAYSMEASEAEYVSDMLFATIQRGVTTMKELAPNIGKAIAAAAMVGVDAPQVLAMISSTTRMGVSTRETITAINRLMLNFSKQTAAASDIALKYGFNLDTIKESKTGLVEVFSKMTEATDKEKIALVGSVRAFKAMAAGVIDVKGQMYDLNYIRNAAGLTDIAMEKIEQTVAFKSEQIGQTMQVAMLKFGELILPIFEEILTLFESLESSGIVEYMERFVILVGSAIGAFAFYEAAKGIMITMIGLSKWFPVVNKMLLKFQTYLKATTGKVISLKMAMVGIGVAATIIGAIATSVYLKMKFNSLEQIKLAKEEREASVKLALELAQQAKSRQKLNEQMIKTAKLYKELNDLNIKTSKEKDKEIKLFDSLKESAKLAGKEIQDFVHGFKTTEELIAKLEEKAKILKLEYEREAKASTIATFTSLIENQAADLQEQFINSFKNQDKVIQKSLNIARKDGGQESILATLSPGGTAGGIRTAMGIENQKKAFDMLGTELGQDFMIALTRAMKADGSEDVLVQNFTTMLNVAESVNTTLNLTDASELKLRSKLSGLKHFMGKYITIAKTFINTSDLVKAYDDEDLNKPKDPIIFKSKEGEKRLQRYQDEYEKFSNSINAKKAEELDKLDKNFEKATAIFQLDVKMLNEKEAIYKISNDEVDGVKRLGDEQEKAEQIKLNQIVNRKRIEEKLIDDKYELQKVSSEIAFAEDKYIASGKTLKDKEIFRSLLIRERDLKISIAEVTKEMSEFELESMDKAIKLKILNLSLTEKTAEQSIIERQFSYGAATPEQLFQSQKEVLDAQLKIDSENGIANSTDYLLKLKALEIQKEQNELTLLELELTRETSLYDLGVTNDLVTLENLMHEIKNKKLQLMKIENNLSGEALELQKEIFEQEIKNDLRSKAIQDLELLLNKMDPNKKYEHASSDGNIYEMDAKQTILNMIAEIVRLKTIENHLNEEQAKDLEREMTQATSIMLSYEQIIDLRNKLNKTNKEAEQTNFETKIAEQGTTDRDKYLKSYSNEEIINLIKYGDSLKNLTEEEKSRYKWVKLRMQLELTKRSAFNVLGIESYQNDAEAIADIENQLNQTINDGIQWLLNQKLEAIEKAKKADLDALEEKYLAQEENVNATVLTEMHKGKVLAALKKEEEKEKKEVEEKFAKDMAKQKKNNAKVTATLDFARGLVGIWSSELSKGIFGLATAPILTGLLTGVYTAQMAMINNTKYASGGYTGSSFGTRDETGRKPVGIVHDEEFVLNHKATNGNVPELYALQASLASGKSVGDFAMDYLLGKTMNVKMPRPTNRFASGGHVSDVAMSSNETSGILMMQTELLSSMVRRLEKIEKTNKDTSENTWEITKQKLGF